MLVGRRRGRRLTDSHDGLAHCHVVLGLLVANEPVLGERLGHQTATRAVRLWVSAERRDARGLLVDGAVGVHPAGAVLGLYSEDLDKLVGELGVQVLVAFELDHCLYDFAHNEEPFFFVEFVAGRGANDALAEQLDGLLGQLVVEHLFLARGEAAIN